MQFEQVRPIRYLNEMNERLAELKQTLLTTKRKTAILPQGHLKIATKATHTEFYHTSEPGAGCTKYIKSKNISFAAQLAQKDYNLKLIKAMDVEIAVLEDYLKIIEQNRSVTAVYEKLCHMRKSLTIPVTLTDSQYCEKWQAVTWEGKGFSGDSPQFFTAKEERVRSKSEVIIADTLARNGIPYRYEFSVNLKKSGGRPLMLYPDFMCLNVRTREEFFWEHFGMMDDPDYVKNCIRKLGLYAENDIFPGRGLIISMETASEPLNTKEIERIIKNYLK